MEATVTNEVNSQITHFNWLVTIKKRAIAFADKKLKAYDKPGVAFMRK
ncbi:MAG: hypothetical protein PHI28_06835 [Mangrovibacterium sp.]|nr:hypothetical protein [Mangrovibacterium sp.]